MELLKVEGLTVRDEEKGETLAENISFSLSNHECLGIIGESGSGKSVTCRALLGLLQGKLAVTGSAAFGGEELIKMAPQRLREIRAQHISLMMQDAMNAFDPLYTIGAQLAETFREARGMKRREAWEAAVAVVRSVGLAAPGEDPARVLKKYPHQLSGGMLQRCMTGLALALKPEILIADEPTTALDSINQRAIVENIRRLRRETGMAVIFISHDLGVVKYLADRLLVMRRGRIVESGEASEVFEHPQEEYTRYLIESRRRMSGQFRRAVSEGGAHD